jgi:hypothetical protein
MASIRTEELPNLFNGQSIKLEANKTIVLMQQLYTLFMIIKPREELIKIYDKSLQ